MQEIKTKLSLWKKSNHKKRYNTGAKIDITFSNFVKYRTSFFLLYYYLVLGHFFFSFLTYFFFSCYLLLFHVFIFILSFHINVSYCDLLRIWNNFYTKNVITSFSTNFWVIYISKRRRKKLAVLRAATRFVSRVGLPNSLCES